MREYVIAGNWKMNNTPKAAYELVSAIAPKVKDAGATVVVLVPFVDIADAVKAAAGTNIKVGAQNLHWEANGAFTGEISAKMLTEAGCEYVVVGHSERRQYFGETDDTVHLRLKAAIEGGLRPILCVGETLDERKKGITFERVATQVKIAMMEIEPKDAKNVIIAYEPVWAIGTGVTASDDQAQEVCEFIRHVINTLYGEKVAKDIVIQYGGSMNAKNAAGLLKKPDIDGGLIGGASLKADDFAVIVEAAGR